MNLRVSRHRKHILIDVDGYQIEANVQNLMKHPFQWKDHPRCFLSIRIDKVFIVNEILHPEEFEKIKDFMVKHIYQQEIDWVGVTSDSQDHKDNKIIFAVEYKDKEKKDEEITLSRTGEISAMWRGLI